MTNQTKRETTMTLIYSTVSSISWKEDEIITYSIWGEYIVFYLLLSHDAEINTTKDSDWVIVFME